MDYNSAESRYQSDPVFHAFVDAIYNYIQAMELTPTEVREAAMLACIKFEQTHSRSFVYDHEKKKLLYEEELDAY